MTAEDSPRARVPVFMFIGDLASEASRAQLRKGAELADIALYDRAIRIAEAAGARFVAFGWSRSGGDIVVPLIDLRALWSFCRLLFDLADSRGAICLTRSELDRETLTAVNHGLAGRTPSEAQPRAMHLKLVIDNTPPGRTGNDRGEALREPAPPHGEGDSAAIEGSDAPG